MTLPTLSDEQQRVIDYLEHPTHKHENVFITGVAGSGKSVVLRSYLNATQDQVLVAAPTGVAANNVDGVTLHSLLGLGTGLIADEHTDVSDIRRKKPFLLDIDALVVDEVSMVSSSLLDAIDRQLRRIRQNDLPFGGVRMIFMGDLYQLPPTKKQEIEEWHNMEGYRSLWFFDAFVWAWNGGEADLRTFGLQKVFRQKDPVFKRLLNSVRDATIDQVGIDELNSMGKRKFDDNALYLSPWNAKVDKHNEAQMKKLKTPVKLFEARVSRGWDRDNDPTVSRKLYLKAGSRIIMLNNHKDEYWVNGTPGMVTALTPDLVFVRLDTGREHAVSRHTWLPPGLPPEAVQDAPKFTQFPLKAAWGLTIHKAQGQTASNITIDLDKGAFEAGMTYVALSRVTSPVGLHLVRPIQRTDIRVDPNVVRFFTELAH